MEQVAHGLNDARSDRGYEIRVMDMSVSIFVIAVITLVALGIGLLLRRLLVRRLKKTILDNWLIQTLGIIVIFPPLIIAAVTAPFILNNWQITFLWIQIQTLFQDHVTDIVNLSWGFIETVLVLVLGVGIARTVMKMTIRGLSENHIDVNIRTLIGRIFFIITVIVVLFWILSIWHVAIDLPVAVIGTLTVAFTFAIQDIIKDLVAGFYILMERPFHIGDIITIGNAAYAPLHTGKVEDIRIRSTQLRITSGEQVIVPNALIFSGVVINNSYYAERCISITVKLPQEEFVKDETPGQIIKTLKEMAFVAAKPEPTVMISGYSGKLVTLTVHFWIASEQLAGASGQLASVSEVMYTLHTVLPNADIALLESASEIK
jgi:small-conductance mechanosensitive channel